MKGFQFKEKKKTDLIRDVVDANKRPNISESLCRSNV